MCSNGNIEKDKFCISDDDMKVASNLANVMKKNISKILLERFKAALVEESGKKPKVLQKKKYNGLLQKTYLNRYINKLQELIDKASSSINFCNFGEHASIFKNSLYFRHLHVAQLLSDCDDVVINGLPYLVCSLLVNKNSSSLILNDSEIEKQPIYVLYYAWLYGHLPKYSARHKNEDISKYNKKLESLTDNEPRSRKSFVSLFTMEHWPDTKRKIKKPHTLKDDIGSIRMIGLVFLIFSCCVVAYNEVFPKENFYKIVILFERHVLRNLITLYDEITQKVNKKNETASSSPDINAVIDIELLGPLGFFTRSFLEADNKKEYIDVCNHVIEYYCTGFNRIKGTENYENSGEFFNKNRYYACWVKVDKPIVDYWRHLTSRRNFYLRNLLDESQKDILQIEVHSAVKALDTYKNDPEIQSWLKAQQKKRSIIKQKNPLSNDDYISASSQEMFEFNKTVLLATKLCLDKFFSTSEENLCCEEIDCLIKDIDLFQDYLKFIRY